MTRAIRFQTIASAVIAASAAVFAGGAALAADPIPDGTEFQASEWTTGFQGFPRVATHSDGSFVVVWDDYGRDGSYYGIFGRRFASTGQPVGPSFLVNTTTIDYQRLPSISMDDSGNFVVVWDDYGQDGDGYGVVGQLFDSTGTKVGSEFVANTYTTDWQRIPDVAMDDAGNFVVIWESRDQDGDLYGVFGQLFDSTASPVGGEFQVSTYTTDNQEYPRVSMNGSGDFLVVWESNLQDGSGDGIRGQRYDSAGSPAGGEFQVNSYATFNQLYPVAMVDPMGNFVIAWDSAIQDGEGAGIFMRRFDSTGAALSGDLQVNTYTSNYQTLPAISGDDDGNFVVAWNSFNQVDPNSFYDIFGQAFDSSGVPVGNEFQVNTETYDYQRIPALSMNGLGDFVVVWDSFYQDGDASGIFGQRFCLPTDPLCGFVVTSPLDGGSLDCSDPATSVPTITWDTGRFERFRVWAGSDPGFVKGTRIKSWDGWKAVTSWMPSKKKWKSACKKAVTADPNMPVLHIRVEGRDDDLPNNDPAKYDFTPTVMVDATF